LKKGEAQESSFEAQSQAVSDSMETLQQLSQQSAESDADMTQLEADERVREQTEADEYNKLQQEDDMAAQ